MSQGSSNGVTVSNGTKLVAAQYHLLILAVITSACLAPFAGKAFNIDDPLFLWAAQHIQSHPIDFYGFSVNWIGAEMPMTDVMFNPPLTSYFIAAIAAIVGWSEKALHLTFLIPALAAASGTYFVARYFCQRPLHAALAAVLTPAFLVSATSVMSDVMTLAFWVWAVFFWLRGLNSERYSLLVVSAFLIGLGTFAKYFCISLVPLLLAYTLVHERRATFRVLPLLIPIVMLAVFELLGVLLYGKPLFLTASHFSSEIRNDLAPGLVSSIVIGLSFAGGGLLTAFLYVPWLWSGRVLAAGASILLIAVGAFFLLPQLGPHLLRDGDEVRWLTDLQLGVFVVAGFHIALLAVDDFRSHKDASSLLLGLWLGGTFIFSTFFNWVITERTILPMVPAIGILIMRRIDRLADEKGQRIDWRSGASLVVAAGFGLLLSWSDYRWANSIRSAAATVCTAYHCGDKPVWFAGHWGFQYYMQKLGAMETDWGRPRFAPGETMVLDLNSYVAFPLKEDRLRPVKRVITTPWKGLATMNRSIGAGYYMDQYGPLPYAVGWTSPDEYLVFELR